MNFFVIFISKLVINKKAALCPTIIVNLTVIFRENLYLCVNGYRYLRFKSFFSRLSHLQTLIFSTILIIPVYEWTISPWMKIVEHTWSRIINHLSYRIIDVCDGNHHYCKDTISVRYSPVFGNRNRSLFI